MMRPPRRTRSPVSVPGSRPSCRARTAAIGTRSGKLVGYGSVPPARNASTLARRSLLICCSASCGSVIERAVYAGPSRRLDAHDLELDGAARRGHLDHIALLVTEHGLPHRRLVREPVVGRVGLGRADDLVLVGLPIVDVLDFHLGADRHHVLRDVGGVDDARGAELLLQAGDAALEQRLLVLGVVVLGVLGDVAELASGPDPVGDLTPLDRLELLDGRLQLFVPGLGEDDVFLHDTFPWWCERGTVPEPRDYVHTRRLPETAHLQRFSPGRHRGTQDCPRRLHIPSNTA